jgi:gliding motility-associated lipoprotein GldH
MMHTRKKYFLWFCLGSFALVLSWVSCQSNRVFEDNVNIPGNTWERDNPVQFEVHIMDTLNPCNIYVNVRNTGRYPKSNLFLFIETTSPLEYSVRDTFEIRMADKRGKWFGKGFGDVWSHQVLYKKNIRFPYTGFYHFTFEQAMRDKNLPGIVDVGLKIEKVGEYQKWQQEERKN